ncbi:MAG: GFA family protein [Pseudomonadales bacterium]|nr:GFA family protein [Pseudomonadales bacterium]
MSGKIDGACLCGEIRYEINNRFDQLYFCHCKQCQKTSGSVYLSNLFCEVGSLSWLSGENLIKRFDYPGREFSNAFCKMCGSGVPYLNANGTAIVVRAGSLNGKPIVETTSRIFYAERSQWADECETANTYARFPWGA